MNLRAHIAAITTRTASSRPLLVIAGVMALAVVLWLVVKVLPEWFATGGIEDAAKRDEAIGRARTGVLAVLAGGLATIGAYYTHRTFGLNRQGQITERFMRAVDQLGNSSLDVRLGGIYALERLARESRDDHGPIIEILTAYVREHTRPGHTRPDLSDRTEAEDDELVATDIQAALTVIGRRTTGHDPAFPWHVNLGGAHVERAVLGNAHLEGAFLARAHLEAANLAGAHLQGANLDDAHLQGASLIGADLGQALLRGAHLEGAGLNGARLEEANLNGAHLKGARLVGAHLGKARLEHAHLEGAHLADAHLQQAVLARAHLERAYLDNAHLEGARLDHAHLQEVSLVDATWSEETVWPEGFRPPGSAAPPLPEAAAD